MICEEWIVASPNRLDVFLRERIPELLSKKSEVVSAKGESTVSNSKIRRLIVAGVVQVNKRQCRIPAYDLHPGEKVTVQIDEEKFFFEKQPDDIKFEVTENSVLFEDDNIIVVNKPAFFPTEETITGNRDNLHDAVLRYLWKKNPALRNPPYVGIMHRLDRETSGVILFTKTRAVNGAVHDMFENHTAQKVYRAVCTRKPQLGKAQVGEVPEKFSIDKPIGRISASSAACKMGVVETANHRTGNIKEIQPARTDCSLIGKKGNRYYIEARPHTGRTHQIRVHLSWYGLPLVGDELYGGVEGERIMLHAVSLTFPHPVTKEVVCVTAPLPEGFEC